MKCSHRRKMKKLYQLGKNTQKVNFKLSQYYIKLLYKISRKQVIRLDRRYKRIYCRKCFGLLLNEEDWKHEEGGWIIGTCSNCHERKRFKWQKITSPLKDVEEDDFDVFAPPVMKKKRVGKEPGG